MASRPHLPSVLPSYPGLQEVEEQTNVMLGRITTPEETAIFICAHDKCYRLFPSKDKLLTHKKRDHGSEDSENDILTWNE